MAFVDDRSRWRAVTTRDPSADGIFVYAVKSTHIYCRPVCNARLARQANVDFYDTPQQAEEAGFRACKRCKPELAKFDPLESVLKNACAIIEEAVSDASTTSGGKITLKEIAEKVNLTPRYLHKVFKERMGCTPKQYAESLLVNRHVDGRVKLADSTPIQGTSTPSTLGETYSSDEELLATFLDLVDWDQCHDPEK
jgi:methylphosphotriester-DNA--protein-cysteine methyltransferase